MQCAYLHSLCFLDGGAIGPIHLLIPLQKVKVLLLLHIFLADYRKDKISILRIIIKTITPVSKFLTISKHSLILCFRFLDI